MSKPVFENDICHIAVRIGVALPTKGGGVSIGSGFLYKAPLNDNTDRYAILLISNKHVFSDSKGALQIHLNKRTDKWEPEYGNIHIFQHKDFTSLYYPHPEQDVDLACVNVTGITQEQVFYKHLHDHFLKDIDLSKVVVGNDVLFVGYPENRFDVTHNVPIVRKGSIASLPTLDFNGKPQIIIDAQVFQGSSGSPVFTVVDGQYYLLGVVSETMIRHSKLQTLPTNQLELGIQQIMGLGIVIKQNKVKELIDYAVQEIVKSKPTP